MINILIVDDHAVVRRGLKEIIRETVNAEVGFDEAANGQDALIKVKCQSYDIVLLDISMPGRNGLEVLKMVKIERPKLPVLMVSMYPDEQFALRSFRSGASGYLTKESAPEELEIAISKILGGGTYVSSSASRLMVAEIRSGKNYGSQRDKALSDREYQVACMIASGKALIDISREMLVSEKTISTYRARILEKLNVRSNAELVSYALKHGMITST